MSKFDRNKISTAVNPMGNKHFCYINGVLIGSFNTWHGAHNYLSKKVNELIQNKEKEIQANIKRNKKKQPDIRYPRNQDDEATKAILEYYKEKNNADEKL